MVGRLVRPTVPCCWATCGGDCQYCYRAIFVADASHFSTSALTTTVSCLVRRNSKPRQFYNIDRSQVDTTTQDLFSNFSLSEDKPASAAMSSAANAQSLAGAYWASQAGPGGSGSSSGGGAAGGGAPGAPSEDTLDML